MNNFSSRLKELRKKNGLTQKELAEKLFIDHSSISKYENDKNGPENIVLLQVASFFGVSVDYLLGIDTIPVKEDSDAFRCDDPNIETLIPTYIDYLENKRHTLMFCGKSMSDETWYAVKESLLDELEFKQFKLTKKNNLK